MQPSFSMRNVHVTDKPTKTFSQSIRKCLQPVNLLIFTITSVLWKILFRKVSLRRNCLTIINLELIITRQKRLSIAFQEKSKYLKIRT